MAKQLKSLAASLPWTSSRTRCCKALLNHHLELDVGIPTLGETNSLFKTHPEEMPQVFTPLPTSSLLNLLHDSVR